MTLVWLAAFGAAWWVLVEGRPGAWAAGLLAVGLAMAARRALGPRPGRIWRPGALLRFVPWFLGASVRGGLDVAYRAFHPRLPIRPGLLSYETRLADPGARVFFVSVASLLPGTFSAGLEGRSVTLHVLDTASGPERDVRALERHVAGLWGEPAPETRGP